MITLVPSELSHVRELSRTMRQNDKKEAQALGLIPHHALFYAYKHACFRRTALVDGRVAAMWGVVGTPLGLVGQPYLITGTECDKVSPVAFARIYINELQAMARIFPILENYVDAEYTGAVGMLELAGFTLSEEFVFHDHRFYKFTMKTGI